MTLRTNSLKARFAAGEPALGCSVMIPSPQLVEMLGHAGFDWVLIDMEHGTIGLESADLLIMAAEAVGVAAMVRPRSNSSADITSVMDRGATGVQVPHVNTREDAERAVAAVKFGPADQRGLAAGTRPDRYGMAEAMPNFVARSNAQSMACVQIEHASAIDNVDALLQVDGVDVFFIGPSDLSQSMGHSGNPGAAPVKAAIEQALAKIVAAGKTPGMPATSANVEQLLGRGVRYVYTHLPRLLQAGCKGFLESARR